MVVRLLVSLSSRRQERVIVVDEPAGKTLGSKVMVSEPLLVLADMTASRRLVTAGLASMVSAVGLTMKFERRTRRSRDSTEWRKIFIRFRSPPKRFRAPHVLFKFKLEARTPIRP